jgi:F-type H+-transporting ATPase subunit delta
MASDQTVTKNVRELSDGVVQYLRHEGRSSSMVPKVQRLLSRVSAQAHNEKTALVESSVALTPSEKKGLEQTLSKIIGHDMTVENKINPEIVGGLRIQVADWLVDTSIASQLTKLAESLTA